MSAFDRRAAHTRTFFTRHMLLPKELMGAFQFRMAMTWRVDDPEKSRGFCVTRLALLLCRNCSQPLASEAIFDKLAMLAFEGTPLAFALRNCGRSAAVASTARSVQSSVHALKRPSSSRRCAGPAGARHGVDRPRAPDRPRISPRRRRQCTG